jgi:hypothetical protein
VSLHRSGVAAGAYVLGLALAAPAAAGPPYATDDPQPTEQGHWEVYSFVGGANVPGETAGVAGFDLNYGAAKDLQLTLVIPAEYARTAGETQFGMGAVEVAAKLKVLHAAQDSWMPDVALFPRLFLPTQSRQPASRPVNFLLPVWAQKEFGAWSVFGGGGWQLNQGPGNRHFWTGGLAVTRQVSERLNLGAEVTHRARDTTDGRSFSALNLGVIYDLTDRWSLLASGGPGIEHARDEGRYDFYISLRSNY